MRMQTQTRNALGPETMALARQEDQMPVVSCSRSNF
jgi:hypothetical protein